MSYNPQDILDTILSRLKTLASTDTVIGEPVTVGNMTILPVIRLSVGFAAGSGEGVSESGTKGKGGGGGGGGGASITPVGFIAFDGETVHFVPVSKRSLESLIDYVPEALKKFGIIGRKKSGKRAGGAAADPDTDGND